MSSGSQRCSLQQVAVGCVLAVVFLVVFFAYCMPDTGFHQVLFASKAKMQSEVSNSSSDQNVSSPQEDSRRIQGTTSEAELDTVLLIWMWPFDYEFSLSCSDFNIRCHLTDDKSLYHKAHGVLFHHRDINVAHLPKEPRPWFQKWVWFNMESPANAGSIPELSHLFNLTSNYRFDSNIPVPYGQLLPLSSGDQTFELPAKDKLVCWIVTNWNPKFERVVFYNELKNHVQINTYGGAFDRRVSDEEHTKIISSCKFYLSFENSVYKDYITEKLFGPMLLGTVPVVLGPSRQNYEEHIPADSFIHINDFATPKELAERLFYLDNSTSEYMKYFDWRNRFQVRMSGFGREHACRSCSFLQQNRRYQSLSDLNRWYWG